MTNSSSIVRSTGVGHTTAALRSTGGDAGPRPLQPHTHQHHKQAAAGAASSWGRRWLARALGEQWGVTVADGSSWQQSSSSALSSGEGAGSLAAVLGPPGQVSVEMRMTSFSSMELSAAVPISAPPEVVWRLLTDYENLHTFVPSMTVSDVLERRPNGVVMYQVGAQDVAMGVKFSAAVKLSITEHCGGLPRDACVAGAGATADAYTTALPWPTRTLEGMPCNDISFELIEGDFQTFKGVWRVQAVSPDASSSGVSSSSSQGSEEAGEGSDSDGNTSNGATAGSQTAYLLYALYVRPHPWLPVGLIKGRIAGDIKANLQALQRHAERLHALAATVNFSGADESEPEPIVSS